MLHGLSCIRFGVLASLLALVAACDDSAKDDGPNTGAGGAGNAGAGPAGSTGGGGQGGTALQPTPADPEQLRCGADVCAVPGQLCCYGSVVAGGTDHCVGSQAECDSVTRACDEAADCPSGSDCCTGQAVLPMGATVEGFAGTTCVESTSPANCRPEPGVGKSSVQTCKTGDECGDGASCVLESCYGYPLMTCGGSVDCK